MTARVVLAMMKHETNTFSPVPTDLARFSKGAERPPEGEAVLAAYRGTGSCIAGFIDAAEEAGAGIAPSIAANAPPSGPVETAAYEHVRDAILESVAGGCDAILLDLHGAMVTERHEDGEGELLARIREIAPEVPIGVTLDMHANLYPAMVEHADVIAGYQTYPHIDYHETGLRAARPIFAMLRGEVRPVAAWGNRPMLPHVMRQGSGDFPNRELQARAREMEAAEGAIAASLFTGFPHADIANAGLGCVVVTDGDRAAAERMRDELLDFAWVHREAFVYRIEPLADSIARAREAAAVLGAPPGRVRREIDLRVAGRGLTVGAAFAFAVSLGEFGATSFVPRRPETLTAPLALFRLLGTPGTALRGQAMALAVVLMALTAAVVFVVDLAGDARDGAI